MSTPGVGPDPTMMGGGASPGAGPVPPQGASASADAGTNLGPDQVPPGMDINSGRASGPMPGVEMSPVFQALLLVLAMYMGYCWIQPVVAGLREYLLPQSKVNSEDLRKKRNQAFAAKSDMVKTGFGGSVSSSDVMDDLATFVSAHCQALKKIGLQLITEDTSLQSLHCLSVLIDNCLLKGLTSIPMKNDKLKRELLQFPSGEKMLELCGFHAPDSNNVVPTSPSTGGSAATNSILDKVNALRGKIAQEQGLYVFSPEQKLQALIGRSCIQYCLEISKAKGTRRWLQVDPKVLIPDDLEVTCRDLLFVYANPGKVLTDSANFNRAGNYQQQVAAQKKEQLSEQSGTAGALVESWFVPPNVSGAMTSNVEALSLKERNLEAAVKDAVVEALVLTISRKMDHGSESAGPKSDSFAVDQHGSSFNSAHHSIAADAARLWTQRCRMKHREQVFEDSRIIKRNTKPVGAEEEAKENERLLAERKDFFQSLADHMLLPPSVKISHFHWEGEIPHAFGLQSTQGGSSSSSSSLAGPGRAANTTGTDVAMRQIALEAIPHWRACEAWGETESEKTHVVSVGAALDYTNNRGFVCCVLIKADDSFTANSSVEDTRARLVHGRKVEENPYHYKNVRNDTPWANMRFGANVSDANGKAKMKQKSGF
ncbi:unnamed protein product [Amoebophrya sp. A120]|nr:unnamed protein product [Amoebophrya sp. A120]|eukprot:GSA120T00017620001.1